MEDQLSQLGWGFCSNEEGIEELKHTLLFTTLELETTLITAEEEIAKRQLELDHVKDVLSKTIRERDEARIKCRKLMFEQQNKCIFAQTVGTPQKRCENKYETGSNSEVSSSDDESNSNASLVSSRDLDSLPQLSSSLPREALKLAANRSLPEKGRLLQAVKDAGPLLQNLLLAGPLPQWQHPPPQLATVEIPPVEICSPRQQLVKQDSFDDVNGCFSKKRGPQDCEGVEYSPNTKYHKVALH